MPAPSAATESGTCSDPKTFLDTVEKAVHGGLTAEIRHPDLIAEYVRTYHEERKRLAAELLSPSSPLSVTLLSIQSYYWSARSSDFRLH